MFDRLAIEPEVPNLHENGNLLVDEGFKAVFQLLGTDFDRLVMLLTFSGFNGMPEVNGEAQEDDDHLKGEEYLFCLHDLRSTGKSPSKSGRL